MEYNVELIKTFDSYSLEDLEVSIGRLIDSNIPVTANFLSREEAIRKCKEFADSKIKPNTEAIMNSINGELSSKSFDDKYGLLLLIAGQFAEQYSEESVFPLLLALYLFKIGIINPLKKEE